MRERVASTSKSLFPQIVLVKEIRNESDKVRVKVERIWRLPQRELLVECLEARGLIEGKHYFLKGTFKDRRESQISEDLGIVNFYNATTFVSPSTLPKYCVLVEGEHDEYVFRELFNRFIPYWDAGVELRVGGGSELPRARERACDDGYRVLVVADADKKKNGLDLSALWIHPDMEGVDLEALAEAMNKLWGDRIGTLRPERIKEIIESDEKGSVKKLRSHFQERTNTLLPDENEMKKELRSELSAIWMRQGKAPPQIMDILTRVAEAAFGLKSI